MDIGEFQKQIEKIYFEKDNARGALGALGWLVEEVGELSRAIRRGDASERIEEFSDVMAWLVSLASICDVDMEEAAARYAHGCPKCRATPCTCKEPSPQS